MEKYALYMESIYRLQKQVFFFTFSTSGEKRVRIRVKFSRGIVLDFGCMAFDLSSCMVVYFDEEKEIYIQKYINWKVRRWHASYCFDAEKFLKDHSIAYTPIDKKEKEKFNKMKEDVCFIRPFFGNVSVYYDGFFRDLHSNNSFMIGFEIRIVPNFFYMGEKEITCIRVICAEAHVRKKYEKIMEDLVVSILKYKKLENCELERFLNTLLFEETEISLYMRGRENEIKYEDFELTMKEREKIEKISMDKTQAYNVLISKYIRTPDE